MVVKRLLVAALALIALAPFVSEPAAAQSPPVLNQAPTQNPCYRVVVNSLPACQPVDASHPLPVTGSLSFSGSLPAGSNIIGGVTQSGTWSVNSTLQAGSTTTVTQATAANLNAQVVGNVAAGTADSGNGVKVSGVYNSTLPTYATGQRTDLQVNSKGMALAQLGDNSGNFVGTNTQATDGLASSGFGLYAISFARVFNGSIWDREFTCANTATVNVTAGNTTQVVGLSGSTVIRVCSITVSMSAAGSVGVYTGTGTNCGTGSTALLQDMTLATGTPLAQSAPVGGSLWRSSAGGEICVKAVTGNVTGSLSYTQF